MIRRSVLLGALSACLGVTACGRVALDGALDEDAGGEDSSADTNTLPDVSRSDTSRPDVTPPVDGAPDFDATSDATFDVSDAPIDASFDATTDAPFDDAFDVGLDTAPSDAPSDVPSDVPLGSVCDVIADASCGAEQRSCCTSRGVSFDELGCRDVAHSWCDQRVDAVSVGKATFDGAWLDACAAALRSLEGSCAPKLLTYLDQFVPCSQLFNGTKLPGTACTYHSDCHAQPDMTAFCDASTSRCRAYQIVGASERCNYFGSTIRYCRGSSLYCDYTVASPVCHAATALGGTCSGGLDASCGFGNTCKSGHCAVGAPSGTACAGDLECASWSCQTGKCSDPYVEFGTATYCAGG